MDIGMEIGILNGQHSYFFSNEPFWKEKCDDHPRKLQNRRIENSKIEFWSPQDQKETCDDYSGAYVEQRKETLQHTATHYSTL